MNPRDLIPADWIDALGHGPIGLGHDIATTTKATSNWSSLAVCQHVSPLYRYPLFIRWRADDPEVNMAIIDQIISDIESTSQRPRRLSIDASNEKFHAQNTRARFRGRVPVELVVSGETLDWKGESYNYKQLLGDLYCAAYEDNMIAIPEGKWLLDDHRLVRRESGRFMAEIGKDGGHGDTFDAGKLAYWATFRNTSAPPGSIEAVTIGSTPQKTERPGLKNPLLRLFQRSGSGVRA